jgi:4-aminobutyrate aminotransferase-like enzyme
MDPLLEKLYSLEKADVEGYAKFLTLGGGTRPGPVLRSGKGCWVEDIEGKRYLDCTSQSWAMYLGHANEQINRVVYEHSQHLTHVHQGFDTPSRFLLAAKLAELAPPGLNRASFTVGGGPAVEAAMKIAVKNREGAQEFLCLYDAYHGTTLGVLGSSWVSTLAGGEFIGGARFNRLTRQFIRVPNPYCYRCPLELKRESCGMMCLKVLEATIEKGVNGPVAGLILEPIQASGGQVILPKDYLQRVREICDRYGIVLIFDEIQTYARIGTFFAAGYFGVSPDIIVLGKGLGAGLPIGAILLREGLEGFSPDTEELHTFANNTASQVAGLKLIELLENGVLDNCNRMGAHLAAGLKTIQKDFPVIGDIRQAGLHIGVELVKDPQTREPDADLVGALRRRGLENGVLFGIGGVKKNVLKIKPPLIITRAEADTALELFRKCLQEALEGQSWPDSRK